jgi:hypothetical protein
MSEPILIHQVLKDQYIDLVCRMYKVPTTYEECVESALSKDFHNIVWTLIQHPLTNIHMQYAIFCRVAWAEAVLYGLADLEHKHKMLLSLRDSYHQIQRMPEAWQEAFAPVLLHWLEVLAEEEGRANDIA